MISLPPSSPPPDLSPTLSPSFVPHPVASCLSYLLTPSSFWSTSCSHFRHIRWLSRPWAPGSIRHSFRYVRYHGPFRRWCKISLCWGVGNWGLCLCFGRNVVCPSLDTGQLKARAPSLGPSHKRHGGRARCDQKRKRDSIHSRRGVHCCWYTLWGPLKGFIGEWCSTQWGGTRTRRKVLLHTASRD